MTATCGSYEDHKCSGIQLFIQQMFVSTCCAKRCPGHGDATVQQAGRAPGAGTDTLQETREEHKFQDTSDLSSQLPPPSASPLLHQGPLELVSIPRPFLKIEFIEVTVFNKAGIRYTVLHMCTRYGAFTSPRESPSTVTWEG